MKKYENIYEAIIFFEANIFKNLGLLLVEIVFFIFPNTDSNWNNFSV